MGNKHWVEALISDTCLSIKDKGTENSSPYIEIGDIDTYSKTYAYKDKLSVKGCKLAKKDDIIVSRVRPTRGAISIIKENQIAVSSAFSIIRCISGIDKKFLWYFLCSNNNYLSYLGENCTGTLYPTTSDAVVINYNFPLPPFGEQKRIVEKLDTILPKVKNAKSRLDKTPRILKRFRQSVLSAACSGKLTEDWREENHVVETAEDQLRKILDLRILDKRYKAYLAKINDLESPIEWAEEDDIPSSWVKSKLGVVCPKITDGTHDTPKRLKEGVPYITGKHIRERVIDFEHCDYVSSDDHKVIYVRCNPNKNDVLMVNIGAGTATPALVKVDYEFSMKNVALLKTDPSIISGSYLEYYQLRYKDYIFNQVTKGGAQPFLSLDAIKALPIHLPPLEEQHEIIRRVEKLFKLADSLEAKYAKAMERVVKIEQSVLAKAFRGELAPQDLNDEPAEELLKRILAEKAKLEGVKKKSKRFSAR
jgi:type I restriction enzyme S subunit